MCHNWSISNKTEKRCELKCLIVHRWRTSNILYIKLFPKFFQFCLSRQHEVDQIFKHNSCRRLLFKLGNVIIFFRLLVKWIFLVFPTVWLAHRCRLRTTWLVFLCIFEWYEIRYLMNLWIVYFFSIIRLDVWEIISSSCPILQRNKNNLTLEYLILKSVIAKWFRYNLSLKRPCFLGRYNQKR